MERTEHSTSVFDAGTRPEAPARPGHFAPSDAAGVFSAEFLDEATCRAWVLRRLHPGDPRCPSCAALIVDATTLRNFWSGRRCVCKSCGSFFTATSGTFLQGVQLGYRKVFLLAVLADFMAAGLNVQRLAGVLGVSPDTVRIWIQKFKAIND